MNGLVPYDDTMVQSCSDSQENVFHQSSKLLVLARECHIECFQILQSHLSVLLECDGFKIGFERAFTTLFGQDVQTFTDIMILNLDQLRQQLDREETTNAGSSATLCVLSKQLEGFINSKSAMKYDYESEMTMKCFADHTEIDVDTFRDMLLQYLDKVKKYIVEKAKHESVYEDRVKTHGEKSSNGIEYLGLTSDAESAITECMDSEADKIDTSDKLAIHDMGNMLRPVQPLDPSDEVSSIDQHNILSNVCHHTDQIKLCYDTNLLEKTDSSLLSSNSTNMCHKGGESDMYDESSCLKVECSKTVDQNMVEKETFNQLLKSFSQLEKHCISLEIEMQQKEECLQNSKPCLNPELHGLNEYFLINNLKTQLKDKDLTINSLKNRIKMYEQRNEAKWKHEINETECKMAKLSMENETLEIQCKELRDSIKDIKAKNINLTTSQLTKHIDLIAQSLTTCPTISGE